MRSGSHELVLLAAFIPLQSKKMWHLCAVLASVPPVFPRICICICVLVSVSHGMVAMSFVRRLRLASQTNKLAANL